MGLEHRFDFAEPAEPEVMATSWGGEPLFEGDRIWEDDDGRLICEEEFDDYIKANFRMVIL